MEEPLYTCLQELSRLGSADWTTTERAAQVLTGVQERLAGAAGQEGGRVLAAVTQLLACVDTCAREDVRLQCGCMAAALLHRTSQLLPASEGAPTPSPSTGGRRGADPEAPPAPPHLLSLQQTKVVAAAARLALYTVVVAGLDQEAACYVRMSLARARFVLGPALVEVAEGSRRPLLAATMRLLLPVLKHDTLGSGIRQAAYTEVLSALLCLCFHPAGSKHHPEDTAFFRGQLETLTGAVEAIVTLRHLLLLMGLGGSSGGGGDGRGGGGRGWLGRACSSLVVRRHLMAEGGLPGVVGAGLSLCDGQDVRRCQAVAALIAHVRTPDLGRLYAALGPQVMAMLKKASQLAPEVVRVVVLLAGELAERSPTLAAQHLGQSLLHPLTLTAHHNAPQECVGTSLTECVTRLHMVMVESAPPPAALATLLQPALSPLVAIAALPTTHLRSPARHLVTRYLSHLAEDKAVDTLISLASLAPCTLIPPVHPDLALVLDEAGGVRVEARPGLPDGLEEDEAIASCLSAILEELAQPDVVLAFYKKLVEYLNFREEVKDDKTSGPTFVCLRTEADKLATKFERARQIAICVGLLSCLAESEKLTGDLFQDLSAAGPVVDGLLRAGCQECRDEGLRDIQVSLTANVLVLVSCYVSDRSLRGEMASGDWAGLKALLPALEETEQCLEDEGVCLMATQLRHMVATHGAVQAGGQTPGKAEKVKGKGKPGVTLDNGASRPSEESGALLDLKSDSKPFPCPGKGNAIYATREDNPSVKVEEQDSVKVEEQDSVKVEEQDSATEARNSVKAAVETNRTDGDAVKSYLEEGRLERNQEKEEEKKGDTSRTVKVKEELVEEAKVREEIVETQRKEGSGGGAFKTAMEDLMSPLVPIRGHGILALAKLVEARDGETLQHGTQLLALFQHHMREEDSYLYLMAVRGLAALCDVMPEKAVGGLTREFSVGRRTPEDRAKLAETLSRAARRLGPLLPHYKDHFINAFLAGVRDPEWLVRAASLSALGDVCKELRFSLGPIVQEVFSVLNLAVVQDSSVEVRRAAVLVVTMLLQGLGGDALKVLREVLRELYRGLRRLEATDADPVVRLHAQLALQEVDAIMRRFLLPSAGLTKRIYVMDAPPPAL